MEVDVSKGPSSAFESPTFGQDGSFRLDKPVGSASISPCGRDVVLASRQGLHIIDLDSPWSPPRHLTYHTPWEVADVQWSPFATRDYWVVSTSNQKALVWNLNMPKAEASIEHVLHAHTRAISDINFSASHPDVLATCGVDAFVHCWDLRVPLKPALSFCDWFAGATQVKWNRQNSHILASSHDKMLRIWDDRKGAHPLRSIEAHATKIYGIDWNRLETKNLVTCSLDKTIKLWDYTKESDEAESVIHTPFPVWRARHTPFGYGLLAMPQRSDNNLHLYDHRIDREGPRSRILDPVHSFVGHNDQVKEFLWRTRGTVSETVDDREFQLVSWGADKVLRLHHVEMESLEDVGYRKGMVVKRTMGFTRRGAIYRSFRDDPSTDETRFLDLYGKYDGPSGARMTPGPTGGRNATAPFVGGKYNDSSGLLRGQSASKDIDPITWMRGVRIGKKSNLPGLHESVSTTMSPSLKGESGWETFDSLGEEITHLGEKFSKIAFNEVDVSHRKVSMSLSGPWGMDAKPIYIKVTFGFPKDYPTSATPQIQVEKTASVSDDTFKRIHVDLASIASGFLARQRSSLETLIRYLIGEQSLVECLQSLQKHRRSEDLPLIQNQASSSSDEDDEGIGELLKIQGDTLNSADPMTALPSTQYSVPNPRTCGALWAGNGILVCFFQFKQKEPSLLDQSLGTNERPSKARTARFEGFGQLHDILNRRKGSKSGVAVTDDGDSGFEDYSTSSSDSSLTSGFGISQDYFMPTMAWQVEGIEPFSKPLVDESQRSSGDVGTGNSVASRSTTFISMRDLRWMLPAKYELAQQYVIGNGYRDAQQNSQIADHQGHVDLANVWLLIAMILEDQVPLEIVHYSQDSPSILLVARQASLNLQSKDSALDLSYDADTESGISPLKGRIKWGSHPFARGWLIDALFQHFEREADIQMLAMMWCFFSPSSILTSGSRTSPSSRVSSVRPRLPSTYYPSLEMAASLLGIFVPPRSQKIASAPHSAASSAGASIIDQTVISSESNTPPSYGPLRSRGEHRSSQSTHLSTSPEYTRNVYRSNSNISAFGTLLPRPVSFSNSAASSPPNMLLRKRLSPSGGSLGITTSNLAWTSSGAFAKSSTIREDSKGSFSLSISDPEDDGPLPSKKTSTFTTVLKNQDKFFGDGNADVSMLDSRDNHRYDSHLKGYAQLLDIWNLPISRCELLKFSQMSVQQSKDLLTIGRSSTLLDLNDRQISTLQFMTICGNCGEMLPSDIPELRCSYCHHQNASPICELCHHHVCGLSSPCLQCGHILHENCRRKLLQTSIQECPTGCGCMCKDQLSINIPSEKPPPPQLTRTSNPHMLRGRSRSTNIRDISPAITIIADPEAKTINTRADSLDHRFWRRNSDMTTSSINSLAPSDHIESESPDVAYESLARNLRNGGATGGGRSTPTPGNPRSGLGIRERTSQIWRGS